MRYYWTSNRIIKNENRRIKKLAVKIAGESSRQLKHSHIADDMENYIATVEKSLFFSHYVKHRLIIYPRSFTPRYLPNEEKNYVHTKRACKCLY